MRKKIKKEWLWAYLFIAPIVIGTLIFGVIPIIYSFLISLTNWNGIGDRLFVGIKNFVTLLHDEKMIHEIKNTLAYTIASVPLTLVFSVVVAVLLNQGLKATGFFRVIYFLPNIVMPVAAAMVWRFMLNSKTGIVNAFLSWLHLPTPNWISDPKFIMASIVIVSVWSGIGYNAIILLAGLQSISGEVYEAARLDGAPPFTTFCRITVPLLSPTLFFLLTMGVMNGMKAFDVIFTFTQNVDGGPLLEASRTLVYGIYNRAFSLMGFGEASAEAVILFVMIMFVTVIQFKLQKKWVYYE
ncbi:MAG: sugar ABC transporter permease [Lachnospiraceae bacterium]|nr:sugar ABC transporter permease [Lachnospiraceae bacterium]